MQIAADMPARARVLVADDSTFMRRVLANSLAEAGFDVVGEACDGDEALAMWHDLRPDAMTLDLAMPGTDGIGVLRQLCRSENRATLPVVVVSAFSRTYGGRAVDALAEGAFDLVEKPDARDLAAAAAFVGVLREKLVAAVELGAAKPVRSAVRPTSQRSANAMDRALVIVSSTGGPRSLSELLPRLPAPLGIGGVIVQHMPAGFTMALAERLDRVTRLHVAEAAGGESLSPSQLLLAPGGSHLRLDPAPDGQAITRISDAEPIEALRPRADLTIGDAADIFGERLVLVVMTGMGRDGLLGASRVRAAGGRVVVEAAETCIVHGMPRAIADAGLADEEVPLYELHEVIAAEVTA